MDRPALVPTKSAPASSRARTCAPRADPPDAFTPTPAGARWRKNAMSSGVATPTAPLLAFFSQAAPAATASSTARSRSSAPSSGSSSMTFMGTSTAATTAAMSLRYSS